MVHSASLAGPSAEPSRTDRTELDQMLKAIEASAERRREQEEAYRKELRREREERRRERERLRVAQEETAAVPAPE